MTTDAEVRGRFVWYELLTSDPKAAPDFYKAVFAWNCQQWGFGPFSYTLWTRGTAPMGGVKPLPSRAAQAGTPPHWLPYVAVPDVNATVQQAEVLGARTHVAPKTVPMIGRFAILADPQGAAFAAVTPAVALPADTFPEVGQVSWHELATPDPAAGLAFYGALFGWEKTTSLDRGPQAGGLHQMFGRQGRNLGAAGTPAGAGGTARWWLYVRVDDAAQAGERVKSHGGQLLEDVVDVPNGDRVARCIDPQGAVFGVHQVRHV